MAVLNTGLAKTSAAGFTIPYSCRFGGGSGNTYLHKTDFGVGNRKTWTFSAWVKRSRIGYAQYLMASTVGSAEGFIRFNLDDTIEVLVDSIGNIQSTAVFRDPSAWYHIVVKCDATNNDLYVYVNNVVVASDTSVTDADGAFNYDINHDIGRDARSGGDNLEGYLAEVHFIDGTALTPTSFGESGDYGEWKPIKVSGLTYGTNGFYLDFSDAANLGDDAEGSFDWDETDGDNITAKDQMLDTPTNNFCTLNAIDSYFDTMAEGNLEITHGGDWKGARGTLAPSTGKWYYEVHLDTATTWQLSGIFDVEGENGGKLQDEANWRSYRSDGSTQPGGGGDDNTSLANNSSDDIIQVAYDLDASKIWFGINNSWIVSGDPAAGSNEIYSNLSGTYAPAIATYSSTMCVNFGQDSSFAGNKTAQGETDSNGIGDFYYEPPADFLALCTSNMPDVAVTPSEHFNTVLYSGDTSVDRDITGVGFDPDFVWLKARTDAYEQLWFDKLRGAGERIYSHSNSGQSTNDSTLNAFITDGFTVGNGSTIDLSVNGSGKTYVSWNWKANGAGSSNTTGSTNTIATSANVDAGFSISTYAGNDTINTTIGHGLSKAPELVIVKDYYTSGNWEVYEASTDNKYQLNNTSAGGDDFDFNYGTNPSATVVNLAAGAGINRDPDTYVMYCWHSVDGYSKVGSYTGNDNADGTFVYTGFRPAFVMVKNTVTSGEGWLMVNNKIDPINPTGTYLSAQSTYQEQGTSGTTWSRSFDFLSNGFKCRGNSTEINDGEVMIYIAFAETPFKYSNAR